MEYSSQTYLTIGTTLAKLNKTAPLTILAYEVTDSGDVVASLMSLYAKRPYEKPLTDGMSDLLRLTGQWT